MWGEIGNYLTLDGTNGVTNSGDLSPLAKAVMAVWKDPRVAGTLQAVGGVAIICVAVGGSVGSGGTSLALLWVGADQTLTGLKQAYYEAPQQSYTDQAATGGAKALGASDETAAYIGRTTDTAGVLLAGAVTIGSSYANAGRMGNVSIPKAAPTRTAAAETASTESAIATNKAQEAGRKLKVIEEANAKCPPCPKVVKTPLTVNEESIAKALEGSTLTSPQGKVSLPIVERYVRRLEAGDLPPAIKVDGNVIVEGNHRYVAGRVFGTEPPITPGTLAPSQASRVKPIQETVVDPADWGNY